MQPDFADAAVNSETLGIRAVGFLLSRPPDLAHFLDAMGYAREDLERFPSSRRQLVAALEYLLIHEGLLLQFTLATGKPLEAVYEAWRAIARPRERMHAV